MPQKQSFTNGKIYGPLFRFMMPLLFANFLQALYSAGDMLIIGLFGTTGDVSAVATGTGLIDSIRMLIAAFSIGTTVLLGQQIGKERPQEGGQVIGTSVWFFSLLAAELTAVLFVPAHFWAEVMQAPAEALTGTTLYIRICAVGTIFVALYNVIGSIFRGLGDSKTPLIIVSVSFVLNFIADLILVGHFRLGAAGSAITNVFAQALSVALGIWIIKKKQLPFRFSPDMIRCEKIHLSNLVKIGAPMALQDVLVSLSFLVITAIVNDLGVVASASAGVAEKVCAFIMIVPSSFSQALSAYAAQNIGAEKPQRAVKGMIFAMMTSFGMGVLMFWLAYWHGDLLVSLFVSGKPEVVLGGADYLRAYAVSCLLTAFMFCFHGFFIGVGHTKFVMWEGIAGAFLVRIPVAFLMSRRVPVSLFHVALATPCADVVQLVLDLIYFRFVRRHPETMKPLEE